MAAEALERSLATLLGGPGDVAVEHLRRLSGGASRETWSFDAVAAGQRRPLILQRLRPGAAPSTTGIPIHLEAQLLRQARASGVAVAEVVASDDGTVLGTPGMVVERLEGETIARRLLRDDQWAGARARLGRQVGEALARIHAMPPDAVPGLPETDPLEQLRGVVDLLGEPHPALELGFRWLDANRPPGGDRTVVHGDLRMGNLLVGPDGLRAVLDWELAHIGRPLEDLGWFCVRAWRFGSPLPAGGVATRDQLVEAYEAASGRVVDREALRWWEALGTLRWGVICIVQASGHLSGATRSVELAAIGRRVCENEWDLLGLLPGGPLPAAADQPAQGSASLHDRPTMAELAEAVREWVDGEVRPATDGALAFSARVAGNALRVVEREARLEPGLTEAHRARLAGLGFADDRELAAAIRAGQLDHRFDELRAAVGESVRDKLRVANPRWLEPDE